MYTFNISQSLLLLRTITIFTALTSAQTYSNCNPLTQTCPADPALGTSKNINFANGFSSDFIASGGPSYDQNGAAFTIAKSGDSPTMTSKWYIMFGHVDFVIKTAPGQGVVSSAVLLSDCLDEIDWEWLGGDDTQVQSNYFGKGQTGTYNRGAFHGASGNHDSFNTYSIDWTAEQIIWSINGNAVRVLKASDAPAGQYPQTPMQVKVGTWAGGDPANAAGTVAWAGGPIDYSRGPYTMYLKAVAVTDYSTGTSYSYSGTSGTWQSIKSNGGTISSSGTGKNTPQVSNMPTVTSASGAPAPFSTDAAASSVYATRTGYPWVTASASAVTTVSHTPTYTSVNGLPSGWTIGSDGKVRPPSAASLKLPPDSSSSPLPAASSASGFEVKTSYNQQGFPTTVTYDPAIATLPTSYDISGFPITTTPVPRPATTSSPGVVNGAAGSSDGSLTTMQVLTQSISAAAAMSSQPVTPQAVESGVDCTTIHHTYMLAVLAFALALLML